MTLVTFVIFVPWCILAGAARGRGTEEWGPAGGKGETAPSRDFGLRPSSRRSREELRGAGLSLPAPPRGQSLAKGCLAGVAPLGGLALRAGAASLAEHIPPSQKSPIGSKGTLKLEEEDPEVGERAPGMEVEP